MHNLSSLLSQMFLVWPTVRKLGNRKRLDAAGRRLPTCCLRNSRAFGLVLLLVGISHVPTYAQVDRKCLESCSNACFLSDFLLGDYEGCIKRCEEKCKPPLKVGVLYPKYQILTILYAPPGCTSTSTAPCGGTSMIDYQQGSSTGTRVSTEESFTQEEDTSVDVSLTFAGFESLGVNRSDSFSITTTESVAETISKGQSVGLTLNGNRDGINHNHDQFILLLNPAVAVKTQGTKTWWHMGHTGAGAVWYPVNASWLKDPSTMPQNVADLLTNRGFTTSDYETILAQNPFCANPGPCTSSVPLDSRRFVPTTLVFPYQPPPTLDCDNGVCNCTAYTGSITNNFEKELSSAEQSQDSKSYSVDMTFPGGTKLTELNIKHSNTFTWTNSASKAATTSSSQSATVMIRCPSVSYTGLTVMGVYWDLLYGSFMFKPLDYSEFKLSHEGTVRNTTGRCVRQEPVELSYDGKTYRTVTDQNGNYRFFVPKNEPSVALPATGQLTVRGFKQEVALQASTKGEVKIPSQPDVSKFEMSPLPSPKFKLERGYQFKSTSSPGLNTHSLTFPNGSKLIINFPNDIAAGDTFSGTVQTEVTGKDEKQRERNQAEIDKSALLLGGQPIRATEKIFTRTIPRQYNAEEAFVVLKVKGKEVVSVQLPVSQTPVPPTANTQLPACGQMGSNIVVMNHSDGIIAPTDSASIGGTPLYTFAKSTRMSVMQNTSQVAGLTEIKYSEQGRQFSRPFMNLGVALTSPNTNLLRGQKTTMEVVVSARGIQQDISLDLVNDTPGVVSISGGDKQHFTIRPADVQADGTYRQTFTVTANSAGAWGATATVFCVGQGAGCEPSPLSVQP